MSSFLHKDSTIWQWALFCFILAGLTGFLYRLGLVTTLPYNLNLENIRHAHSHLMFFGWASLLPLYLIAADAVPGYHAAVGAKMMKYSLWAVVTFGLLSYPFFMIWGYHPVPIFEVMLPLSVIISGLVMIGWYSFMAGYIITRLRKHSFKGSIWFEAALVMLFVCSIGAWGVGLLEMLDIGTALSSKALTHFFLAVFIEGWLVLILLGLIAKALNLQEDDFIVSPQVLVGLIAFGAPLTFSYGIPESLVSINISVATRLGGLLLAEGVLLFMYSAFKKAGKKSIWIWPILFMVIKALMQLIASLTPADLWLSDHGVRILYLHVMLLGGFSTAVIIYLGKQENMRDVFYKIVIAAVVLLLLSLLLVTSIWPDFLWGMWIYNTMVWIAILPVIAVSIFWMKLRMLVKSQKHSL